MRKRLRIVGTVLAIIGLGFIVGGGVAFSMTQDGYTSLQAFSEAQNVTLSYNEEGQLLSHGTPERAQNILALLTEDWGFPVNEAHLDPNDPVVNTATEYMFQMATVGYSVLNSTQTVVLAEDVEYDGVLYEAGTHEFDIAGRYFADLNHAHPIESQARELAWSGTVLGLFGTLGVGAVTHSALQLAMALSGVLAGVGATLVLAGGGLVWVGRSEPEVSEGGTVPAAERDTESV